MRTNNNNKVQRNKTQVVLKLKRKHDESPEETIVIEEREKKRTKVNFIDQFSKMGLQEQEQPTYCQKLFRYIGTGPREFDITTKIKETQNHTGLPTIKTKKQLEEENNENSMMMNVINGQIAKKERSKGFEIFELEQITSANASGNALGEEEFHYYYLDEVAKVEKGKKYAAIRVETFLCNEEDEYDDDGFGTDDEKSVDYGDTPDSSVESWEKDDVDTSNSGGGFYDRQSSDSYSDYF
jgi:hypothetical protein